MDSVGNGSSQYAKLRIFRAGTTERTSGLDTVGFIKFDSHRACTEIGFTEIDVITTRIPILRLYEKYPIGTQSPFSLAHILHSSREAGKHLFALGSPLQDLVTYSDAHRDILNKAGLLGGAQRPCGHGYNGQQDKSIRRNTDFRCGNYWFFVAETT